MKLRWTVYPKNRIMVMNIEVPIVLRSSPGGSMVKNLSVNAGDVGLMSGQEDPLEKEMATHFSILAWEIPWTEEPLLEPDTTPWLNNNLGTDWQYWTHKQTTWINSWLKHWESEAHLIQLFWNLVPSSVKWEHWYGCLESLDFINNVRFFSLYFKY